jgi:transcriptional regulator with XRE-family HTH domain
MSKKRNIIGERIRQARLMKNPKLTQLALVALLQLEGLDVDQTQVSKMELGTRPITDYEVVTLAKVLNVSSSWLLGETENIRRTR